jgi:hypothetical protein
MLGPGVSITHAAISVLAHHGCLGAWCGEEGVRFYAMGMGETRSAAIFCIRRGCGRMRASIWRWCTASTRSVFPRGSILA